MHDLAARQHRVKCRSFMAFSHKQNKSQKPHRFTIVLYLKRNRNNIINLEIRILKFIKRNDIPTFSNPNCNIDATNKDTHEQNNETENKTNKPKEKTTMERVLLKENQSCYRHVSSSR